MAIVSTSVERHSLSDLLIVKVNDLKIVLQGTIIEILPLSDDSDILLGLGIIKQSRMFLYLSKEGKTTIKDYFNWFKVNKDKFFKPIFLFLPEFDVLSKDTEFQRFYIKHKHDFEFIDSYKNKEDLWGFVSSKLHRQKFFYSPQWAYQFSQRKIFGEQILQFIELMLLNKLTLIINHTATNRITNNISATTCLEGESAVGMRKGTVLDLETTGLDPKESNIVSFGFLNEKSFVILFNHANLNKNSFLLLIKELIKEKVSQPIFAYNVDFEKSFLKGTLFQEVSSFPDGFRARRQESYLPNDDDPGSGANIPVWFKLFLSGGDIKKRKLYRRLILLHNRACLINQLAILCTHYEKTTVKTEWDKFNFPYELAYEYRHTTNSEIRKRLVYRPEKFRRKYSYKDGFYSTYYDEGYLYKLGLRPAPDHYQTLVSSNRASIRMYRHTEAQIPEMIPYSSLDMVIRLREELEAQGIEELYEYQYHAFTQISKGTSTLITAPTGNGKTEAFLLPVLQRILSFKDTEKNINKNSIKALLFYPTKALSNDQLHKLTRWTQKLGLLVKQIDGDVGQYDRKKILKNPPDILLTTPDWLHYNLNKTRWQDALRDVELIIIDEVHTYGGILGTHLYMLLRRIRRIIGKVQIIGASATVGNPKEFFRRLTGEDILVIYCKDKVAKRPELDILLISPKNDTNDNYDVSNLVQDLIGRNYEHTVLVFRNSQQQSEYTYQKLQSYLGKQVDIHRGGLEKTHRQQVEMNLRDGETKAVVCTSSLELGIDVGDISAVITPLVPINNLYQRIGRAGRRDKPALAMLELSNDLVSEYYIRHPKEYFTDVTPITFETNNRRIIYDHLRLAEREKPIQDNEFREYADILRLIEKKKQQEEKEKKEEEKSEEDNDNPVPMFSLRTAGPSMEILYRNRRIATRAFPYAFWEYFPESLRFIGGSRFVVTDVKRTRKFNRPHYIATVERFSEEGFTTVRPIKIESYEYIDESEEVGTKLQQTQILLGKGKIIYTIKGAEKRFGRSKSTNSVFFNQYSYVHRTNILEIEFLEPLTVEVLHTLRHLFRGAIQMKLGLKSEFFFLKQKSLKTSMIIYDASEGGNGSVVTIVGRIKYIFERMYHTIDSCTCIMPQGCPKCTFDLECRNPKIELQKKET
ncbi:MAG: DEAD/DEAH box helicase, partial [Candidatus Hodarchaeales archaeon]